MEEPRKIGRPTLYRKEMCDVVIEKMKIGCSQIEVAAALGINPETLHTWKKKHAEFANAVKRGLALSQAWWEEIARKNLMYHPKEEQLNATLWYMNMKNRFGWRDSHKVEVSDQTITIKIDQEDSNL